jgi:hypothetical protein
MGLSFALGQAWAQRATFLCPPQNGHLGSLKTSMVRVWGVHVYAWSDLGLHLQRGWRGSEKDKIFKFQVWFSDYHDKSADKRSGTFKGLVNVEGVQIGPETPLDTISPQLKKAGFVVTKSENPASATKGEITIWTVGSSHKIQRIEVFIDPDWPMKQAGSGCSD